MYIERPFFVTRKTLIWGEECLFGVTSSPAGFLSPQPREWEMITSPCCQVSASNTLLPSSPQTLPLSASEMLVRMAQTLILSFYKHLMRLYYVPGTPRDSIEPDSCRPHSWWVHKDISQGITEINATSPLRNEGAMVQETLEVSGRPEKPSLCKRWLSWSNALPWGRAGRAFPAEGNTCKSPVVKENEGTPWHGILMAETQAFWYPLLEQRRYKWVGDRWQQILHFESTTLAAEWRTVGCGQVCAVQ